jgi:ABC-type branched-subunit amino acid transport system substrate-binding protein
MRALLAAVLVSSSSFGQPPWKVGMSTVLSGPSQALGQNMKQGVEAFVGWKNAQGGVHGRPLELTVLDDGYEPARAATNMRTLIDTHGVFAVLGNVGTPTAAVSAPIANEKKVPFFGAFTGAGLLRKTPPDRYVINFRASYAEETAEMVSGLQGTRHCTL